VDPFFDGLTDTRNGIYQATGAGGATKVLWLDRALSTTSGLDRNEKARRNAAEQAVAIGDAEIRSVSTSDEASELLQMARLGVEDFDAVVAESCIGGNEKAGVELLQLIDSLWAGAEFSRPSFHLITTSWDGAVASFVKGRPRANLIRCDRPQAILPALAEGYCLAAKITEELPPLRGGGRVEGLEAVLFGRSDSFTVSI